MSMKFVANVMDIHKRVDSHAPHRCGLNIQTYTFRSSSHTRDTLILDTLTYATSIYLEIILCRMTYLPTVPHSAGLTRKTDLCPAVPQQSNSVPHFNNVSLAVKITHVRRQSKAIYVWETRIWKRNGVLTRCVA